MSTDNWVEETLASKSDQLNADDIIAGPIDVVIEGVRRTGTKEQPMAIDIDGGRQPFKPCLGMRRLISAVWGTDPNVWVGRSMRLYRDPDVKYGGEVKGGIRISGMSHIDKAQTHRIRVSRHHKQPFTVEPLQAPQQPSASIEDRIARAAQAYAQATTAEQIDKLATKCEPLFAELNDEQKANLQQIHEASLSRVQG